jgi:hypothetical protein
VTAMAPSACSISCSVTSSGGPSVNTYSVQGNQRAARELWRHPDQVRSPSAAPGGPLGVVPLRLLSVVEVVRPAGQVLRPAGGQPSLGERRQRGPPLLLPEVGSEPGSASAVRELAQNGQQLPEGGVRNAAATSHRSVLPAAFRRLPGVTMVETVHMNPCSDQVIRLGRRKRDCHRAAG